jgi:hypothetical protein
MRTMLRAPCTAITSFARHTTDRSLAFPLTSSKSRLRPCSPSSFRRLRALGGAQGFGFLDFHSARLSRSFAAMAFEKIKVDNPIVEMDGTILFFARNCDRFCS